MSQVHITRRISDQKRTIKRFNMLRSTGGAMVTLLWNEDETKLLGCFADHEAAQRFCDRNGITESQMKSAGVQV